MSLTHTHTHTRTYTQAKLVFSSRYILSPRSGSLELLTNVYVHNDNYVNGQLNLNDVLGSPAAWGFELFQRAIPNILK